jgi:outer membrane protein OmpU
MKKVLFATTALVASAGFAQADIAITGTAEMGLAGGDQYGLRADGAGIVDGNDDYRFHSGYTINFAGSGTTDTGLEFGMNVRYDSDGNADAPNAGPTMDAGTVFISGSFGTLTLGDTDDGADWALGEMALAGGTINDAHTAHAGYNGNAGLRGTHDSQTLRYEYEVGTLGFAVSLEQAEDGQNSERDDTWAVGVKYDVVSAAGTLSLGAGFQNGTIWLEDDALGLGEGADADREDSEMFEADAVGVSVVYALEGGLTIGANYAVTDIDAVAVDGTTANANREISMMGLGVAYETGAWTFAANYGQGENETTTGDLDFSGIGMLVNYDMGGGAVVQAGYSDSDRDERADLGNTDSSIYSLGIAMSF